MSCCIDTDALLDIVHGALLSLWMMYAFIQHFIYLLWRPPGCSLTFYLLCLFFDSKPFSEQFLVSVNLYFKCHLQWYRLLHLSIK